MLPKKAVFYILDIADIKTRNLYACRIIEKIYNNKQTAYVYLADEETAKAFDVQLWTFRDISFIPHEIYNNNLNSAVPVLIGYDDAVVPKKVIKDVLVNLVAVIPPFYAEFKHIIEVIPDNSDLKKLARKRYQEYKQNGYQLESFNIKVA
jgi:DNA polymerase III subunit chi